jgi:peptidoglycan/xylan/chitin deacetylase (PgdA/CDA1 family)
MYHLEKREDGWKAAVEAGHEIGNHTMSHPCSGNFNSSRDNVLEDFTPSRMEEEFSQAADAIRTKLGITPTTFAYPCGQTFIGRGEEVQSYIPLVARHFAVGRRGFDEIHNDPGFCDLAQVTGLDFDGASFERCKSLIDRAIARGGGWLILHGHEVADSGPKRVLTETLDSLCRYCQDPAQEIWIDTVATIGQYVRSVRTAVPVSTLSLQR